mgnify:CR=1 FL=1
MCNSNNWAWVLNEEWWMFVSMGSGNVVRCLLVSVGGERLVRLVVVGVVFLGGSVPAGGRGGLGGVGWRVLYHVVLVRLALSVALELGLGAEIFPPL